MNVNDIVADRIAQARWKAEQAKRRRQELAQARKAGIKARHAQKLARVRQQR